MEQKNSKLNKKDENGTKKNKSVQKVKIENN